MSSATLLHSPRPISCRSSLVCVFCHSTSLPQAHQLSLLSGLCLLPLYCTPPGPSVVAPLWSVSSATLLLSPRPISCRSSLVCVFCHSTALPQAHQLSLLSDPPFPWSSHLPGSFHFVFHERDSIHTSQVLLFRCSHYSFLEKLKTTAVVGKDYGFTLGNLFGLFLDELMCLSQYC